MMLPDNPILASALMISCSQPSINLRVRIWCHESEIAEANAPYIEADIDAAISGGRLTLKSPSQAPAKSTQHITQDD